MCGITGIFSKKITDQHRDLIHAILNNQNRRGPDHQENTLLQSSAAEAYFGHNRLSIIDLSIEANQPMWDATGRYCITYNGEIYNYIELRATLKEKGFIFKTQSDTEVILNAFAYWGIDCLHYFQGPFAFGLFDRETSTLWLCRDRFGVRPLFYFIKHDTLYFASATPILAKAFHLKPNLNYLSQGLRYLVYEDDGPTTAYETLLAVSASSYLKVTLSADNLIVTHNKYYDLENSSNELTHTLPLHNPEQLFQLIADTLNNAVKIRLRADVPVGISLSSGLDSSTVAALVKEQQAETIGFTFGHPQQKKTEGPLVARCADYLNLPMEYIWPTLQEMIAGLFKTIQAQDAPFSSLSIVAQYLLYEKVRTTGVKVLLGGQGGDEAFMGYKKFLLFHLQHLKRQKHYASLGKNLLQLFPMLFAELSALKSYWQHRHRYFGHNSIQESPLHLPQSSRLELSFQKDLTQRQIQDIACYSLPTLLRYEDRNAMGNSIESRLPFLDHRLVELGVALPAALKLKAGYGKWPIRKIMAGKLPNAIRLARYKRGFDLSLKNLLQAGLGKSIRTALHSQNSTKDYLKNSQQIDQIFSDQQFLQRPRAMSEAIALLWLNSKENN